MSSSLTLNWSIDTILEDINVQGFALIDMAYALDYLQALEHECMHNLQHFREASIQNGVVSTIRSDHILWIDETFPLANQHLQALDQLSIQLNQYFFTSIKEVEAHFACYNAGEFYALHRDNPQQKNNRIFSSVFYIHADWQEEWGGQLRLQDKLGNWHIISPTPNRIVIFQSDLLHEVLESKQQRLSITAWLRSRDSALH